MKPPPSFLIQLECRPVGLSGVTATAFGAYANAYVSAPEIAEAIERAHQELKLVGWKSTSEAEAKEVSSETFEQGSKGLDYFEQCQNDVVVLVLHTYRDEH